MAAVPAVGIDLGTTFSAVSFVQDGEIVVIHNNSGNQITPSVVHFDQEIVLIGEEAVKKRRDGERRTIYNIKRIIGRKHDDVSLRERSFPFEILRGDRDRATIRVDAELYSPEQISAFILKYIKSIASKYIGEEVTEAVITVPSNFTDAQRQATKDAGEIAGLTVLQIVNEPTAAAIAFCRNREVEEENWRVLVFDLGGGTFDVSIVEYEGTNTKVLATGGLTDLGGTNFDERIYKHAVALFKEQGINIKGVDWTLMESCEKAKRALSTMESVRITHNRYGGAGFVLTRDTFVELCDDLFEETITLTDKMMADAAIDEGLIDEIMLVGGSTRILRVRELLADKFPDTPMRDDIEPDLAVAQGAALLADALTRDLTTASSSTSLNELRSEASSMGDRTQSLNRLTLLDVAPLPLGLILEGDKTKVLIRKNTQLPFSSYQYCTNSRDDEEILYIEIVEGENAVASANNTLAKVEIKIKPMPKGKNLIKVLLSIDVSGILSVTATDVHTDERVWIEITSDRLDEEERRRMTEELERIEQGG